MKLIKSLLVTALALPVFSFAAEQLTQLTDYPSDRRAKEMVKTKRILIADDQRVQALGYPSSSHTENLATLTNSEIDLRIHVSAFPSKRNIENLNSLGNNVKVSLRIQQCLSSKKELERLQALTKEMEVSVTCNSKGKETKKAMDLANKVEASNSNLNMTVILLK